MAGWVPRKVHPRWGSVCGLAVGTGRMGAIRGSQARHPEVGDRNYPRGDPAVARWTDTRQQRAGDRRSGQAVLDGGPSGRSRRHRPGGIDDVHRPLERSQHSCLTQRNQSATQTAAADGVVRPSDRRQRVTAASGRRVPGPWASHQKMRYSRTQRRSSGSSNSSASRPASNSLPSSAMRANSADSWLSASASSVSSRRFAASSRIPRNSS